MRLFSRSIALFALASLPSLAFAHHGQDFLLLESPSVPHPGDVYLVANSQLAFDDPEQQAALEPALLIGITSRVAFELHAHTEKSAGEPWRYEATAPAIHVLLTDPMQHQGLKIGVSGEYEIARDRSQPDNLELRVSIADGTDRIKWAGNLIYDHPSGANGTFGLALGVRRQISAGFALGVEALGSLDRAAGNKVLGGAYWEHAQGWAIKLGAGAQKDVGGGTSAIVEIGLVLRLRD